MSNVVGIKPVSLENVDIDLLKRQRGLLLDWQGSLKSDDTLEEYDLLGGLIQMLDYMIDQGEGFTDE